MRKISGGNMILPRLKIEDYKGVYILTEKIKIDGERIDLLKLTNTDNALPELSGGYIVKSDKLTGGDVVPWRMPSYSV
jgi:hypothetical protein